MGSSVRQAVWMRPAGARSHRWGALVLLASCGIIGGLLGCGPSHAPRTMEGAPVSLTPQDRLLILAPHPDDEVLCCGGLLQQAVAMQLPVRVVFFTYGDNNQWSFLVYRKRPVLLPGSMRRMGEVRHDEAITAARILGLAPDHLTFLGYPDFGTLSIWHDHWGDRPPFTSMLTRATAVPYPDALRPGAPYKGEEVVRDLTAVLREFRPTKIFVSHPGDHMPDHRSLALFTQIALWDLESVIGTPEVYPYLIHFKRWPRPKGAHAASRLEPPAAFREGMTWRSFVVSPTQLARKQQALAAHRTQYVYNARYLLSFVRSNELFGQSSPIPLGRVRDPIQIHEEPEADHAAESVESAEELTDIERAAFVGLETRSIQLAGDQLVLSIEFSRPLAQAVEASIDVFGYRRDRPFARMPKLHVRVGAFTQAVYDQQRPLSPGTVQVTRRSNQLTIRMPLASLGDPDKVLTGARTFLGEIPLDWSSWRVLDLTSEGLSS